MISANTLIPGAYIAIDNSRAVEGSVVAPFRTVLIGQSLSTGSAAVETIVPVFGVEDAQEKFGPGSQLAEMFEYWFANNTSQEVFAVALADADGSAKATYTATVTASSTKAGTIFLYVNDKLFRIGVSDGDAAADIATLMSNIVGSYAEIPVTTSVDSNVVTFTAKNGGTLGNSIKIRFNWNETEAFPSGVSVAVASGVTGATDPDVSDAIAVLPDEIYGLFIMPYIDSTNLGIFETELDRRFREDVQLEGFLISGLSGSVGAINSVTYAENAKQIALLAAGKDPLTPAYLMCVALGAQVALEAEADPARPFQTLPLAGCVGDKLSNQFNRAEQQSLLANGAATVLVDAGGSVRIQRVVTTYKTNSNGSPDPSYRDANTLFTSSFFRQSLRSRISQKYPRHKLTDDGVSFGPGQPIVTPKIMRSEFISLLREWELAGLVENVDDSIEEIIVTRNAIDRNRLDFILPPDLVNQLRIAAGSIQFRL